MSQLVTGAAPSAGPALTDMRATYGGMSIGLGVLFALAARSSAGQRLGLAGVLAVMLGMATTRALGIVFDGDPNGAMFGLRATSARQRTGAGRALVSSVAEAPRWRR